MTLLRPVTAGRPAPPAPAPGAPPSILCVDIHAHFYPCFDPALFLDSAAANLDALGDAAGAPRAHRCLVVASTSHDDGLPLLHALAIRGKTGPWRLDPTAEPGSLIARRVDRSKLILVAAQQTATAEGLEVIAVGATVPLPRGLPLAEALARARNAGALPVIPWGFGKWWFGRARTLRAVIASAAPGSVCLADSAARPRGPGSPLLRAAAARGIRVLAGTDPLPFRRCAALPGRYGIALEAALDPAHPAASLVAALSAPRRPRILGRRRGPAAAVLAQARLRLGRPPRGIAPEALA